MDWMDRLYGGWQFGRNQWSMLCAILHLPPLGLILLNFLTSNLVDGMECTLTRFMMKPN